MNSVHFLAASESRSHPDCYRQDSPKAREKADQLMELDVSVAQSISKRVPFNSLFEVSEPVTDTVMMRMLLSGWVQILSSLATLKLKV